MAVLATCVALTTACGDDDDGAAPAAAVTTTTTTTTGGTTEGTSAPSAAPDAAAVAFPVTVEHLYGSTTIDARPRRIATLGLQWTDVLLALGEQPLAYAADPLAGPEGIYPWQQGQLDGATALAVTSADDLPYEQLAGLDPDLILVTFLADDQGIFDRLSGIAPTIGLLGDRQVDRWQDMVEVAGRVLAEPAKAAKAVAAVDESMADAAASYPGLRDKSFALANYVPGDSIYVVADEQDGASVFFQELGMRLDPDVLAAADGVSGRANISLEQVGLLDGDLLVIFSNGADPSTLVGYDQLGAVTSGASAELDYAAVVGLNTPSPLSVPYSLEIVRPQLAAAAAAA
jgi:iron complex transport system substrate-binding protein